MQKLLNNGFIHDSLAPDPIVEWETPAVTHTQRAAFGALRSTPGLVVSSASIEEWEEAVARHKQMIANC